MPGLTQEQQKELEKYGFRDIQPLDFTEREEFFTLFDGMVKKAGLNGVRLHVGDFAHSDIVPSGRDIVLSNQLLQVGLSDKELSAVVGMVLEEIRDNEREGKIVHAAQAGGLTVAAAAVGLYLYANHRERKTVPEQPTAENPRMRHLLGRREFVTAVGAIGGSYLIAKGTEKAVEKVTSDPPPLVDRKDVASAIIISISGKASSQGCSARRTVGCVMADIVKLEDAYWDEAEAQGFSRPQNPREIPRPTLQSLRNKAGSLGLDTLSVEVADANVEGKLGLMPAPAIMFLASNKIVVSKALLDLLNTPETLALVGTLMEKKRHEELKGNMRLLKIGCPAAFGSATGMLCVWTSPAKKRDIQPEDTRPVFSRRAFLLAGAGAAIISAGKLASLWQANENQADALVEAKPKPEFFDACKKIENWYQERQISQPQWSL